MSIILYELFAVQFACLLIGDAQTVALAGDFLRVRVLATPLMFMSFFIVYLFQAFGKECIALFLGVARWLAPNIPMLFLLNAIFGMYGIVWVQATADALNAALGRLLSKNNRLEEDIERRAPVEPLAWPAVDQIKDAIKLRL